MAERTNARLLKSREVQASVGSNPTPSAIWSSPLGPDGEVFSFEPRLRIKSQLKLVETCGHPRITRSGQNRHAEVDVLLPVRKEPEWGGLPRDRIHKEVVVVRHAIRRTDSTHNEVLTVRVPRGPGQRVSIIDRRARHRLEGPGTKAASTEPSGEKPPPHSNP